MAENARQACKIKGNEYIRVLDRKRTLTSVHKITYGNSPSTQICKSVVKLWTRELVRNFQNIGKTLPFGVLLLLTE